MAPSILRRLFFHHQRGYRSLAFVLVGALAVGTYAIVTRIPDGSIPGWVLDARRHAVQTAETGQSVIRSLRTRDGLRLAPGDRFGTGLIGVASSPVTTDLGSLPSHRTATDPVFAAAIVQMLYRAGVRPGDLVAVGMTGSYPGFDIDAFAAIEAMHATPLVISSVGSSQYGATDPTLTWPAMEGALYRDGVIHHRSIAVAPGGSLVGSQAEARRQIALASGLPTLPVLPLSQEIKYREHLYMKAATEAGRPIAAFVNIGGSAANIGSSSAESIIPPGLSRPRWSQFQAARLGVVGWMRTKGLPIIAMIDVRSLAKKFGIPYDPVLRPAAKDIAAPPANPIWLAVALAGLMALVVGFHRRGLFRVPDWELPSALRAAMVASRSADAPASGAPASEAPASEAPASERSDGHRAVRTTRVHEAGLGTPAPRKPTGASKTSQGEESG